MSALVVWGLLVVAVLVGVHLTVRAQERLRRARLLLASLETGRAAEVRLLLAGLDAACPCSFCSDERTRASLGLER